MSDHDGSGMDPSEVPILFVCGLHRSGTTALGRLLGSAPGVRAMARTGVPADEGQHLQSSFAPASAHGGAGLFAFDPAAHLTERSPLATRATARAVLDAWTPHWHLTPGLALGWGATGGR